jgi:very-short-patch-repair endonuclease
MARPLPDQLCELLDVQRGVFARWQAAELGIDLDVVNARLRNGRWQRLQLGVYASFTGRLGRDAELWAAVLRAGPQAVLSHHTAAELDGFAPRPSKLIHVTVPLAQHMVKLPGIAVHRSGRLDVTRHPARTPPRTRVEETALDLADLAPTLDDAFGWISRPCNERLTTPSLIRAAMQSRSRVRWRAELELALSDIADGVMSPLENRYVRDVERAHGLPAARRQVLIIRDSRAQYLDNLYEELGIGVELDGQAFHPAEERWHDIGRDNALAADGIQVLRYGWADVHGRACRVAIQFAEVAAGRGWTGTLRRCGPSCEVGRPRVASSGP